jgi:hypothetical protein
MLEPASGAPDAIELSLISRAFSEQLRENDLYSLLQYLNASTEHRFTGVYRFEPGWVVSVALFDRQDPALRLGADVKMKESYCWLTGVDGGGFVIEDALCDRRLEGHAAQAEVRSYIAVLLRDQKGTPWGTLCHFDFAPHAANANTIARLETLVPLVEEMFICQRVASWDPDAPSRPRVELAPAPAATLPS